MPVPHYVPLPLRPSLLVSGGIARTNNIEHQRISVSTRKLECPGISTVNSVQYRNPSAVGTSDAEEGTFDPASANQPLYVNRVLS